MIEKIKESDIANVKAWPGATALDDDIVLLDQLGTITIPHEARRMNFILIALCTKGRVEYTIDTQRLVVNPGEMLIVSERHVVNNYESSADFEGLAIITSVEFFQDAISGIRDLSTVFLFSRSHPVMALSEEEADTFSRYFHIIKKRVADTGNHFRKALVRTLLLAMVYDLSVNFAVGNSHLVDKQPI